MPAWALDLFARPLVTIAETWSQGQPVPLNPTKEIIQARDFFLSDVNARQLSALGTTLITKKTAAFQHRPLIASLRLSNIIDCNQENAVYSNQLYSQLDRIRNVEL